jgi:DUF1365 family protein
MDFRAALVVAVTLHLVLAVRVHRDKGMLVEREARGQRDTARVAAAVLVLLVKPPQVLLLLATAALGCLRLSLERQPTTPAVAVAAVIAARLEQVVLAVAAMVL